MRIRFLKSTFGNDKGDKVTIKEKTDNELYYYDCYRRYCYVFRLEEGEIFEVIDDENTPSDFIDVCPWCGEAGEFDESAKLKGINNHVGCANTGCPAYELGAMHIDDWNTRKDKIK